MEPPNNFFLAGRYYLKGNVLDFTQGGDRLEYANAIFPEDCCNLKEFSVHVSLMKLISYIFLYMEPPHLACFMGPFRWDRSLNYTYYLLDFPI